MDAVERKKKHHATKKPTYEVKPYYYNVKRFYTITNYSIATLSTPKGLRYIAREVIEADGMTTLLTLKKKDVTISGEGRRGKRGGPPSSPRKATSAKQSAQELLLMV